MAEVINYRFKYAIELNTIIDEYKGECSFEHLIKIEPKTRSNLNSIVSKINNSVHYVSEKYGDVREYHLFYLPAFMGDTDNSSLINIVKADNNGTTIVFCDKTEIVPSDCIKKIICFKEESKC